MGMGMGGNRDEKSIPAHLYYKVIVATLTRHGTTISTELFAMVRLKCDDGLLIFHHLPSSYPSLAINSAASSDLR